MNEIVAKEVMDKHVAIAMRITRISGPILWQLMRRHMELQKAGAKQIEKPAAEYGKMEQIEVRDGQARLLLKELNRQKVQTSVVRDPVNGSQHIIFAAKDRQVMDAAFKATLAKYEQQMSRQQKPSIRGQLKEIRKMLDERKMQKGLNAELSKVIGKAMKRGKIRSR